MSHETRQQIQQQSQITRLLTPDDVARLLCVTRTQVIRQSRTGKIPSLKLGKCYRYRASTIELWLQQQEQAGVA